MNDRIGMLLVLAMSLAHWGCFYEIEPSNSGKSDDTSSDNSGTSSDNSDASDQDGDGYTVSQGDCDDEDAAARARLREGGIAIAMALCVGGLSANEV